MAKKKNESGIVNSLDLLAAAISQTNEYFLNQVQRQVNTALTLRNWIIGLYIVEYEQQGKNRAIYGEKLFKEVTTRLKAKGIKSIRERHLYLCKDLYNAYPEILRTPSAESLLIDFKDSQILRTASAKSDPGKSKAGNAAMVNQLLTNLSFSHFIELLKAETPLKRNFYEVQAIKNNWSVRELQRAINSMLFERTGLTREKKTVLESNIKGTDLKPEDVFRNPYLLEFLELEEKSSYSETDLEQAIIDHLQKFLLEMGRGFCFEARQKRITFDNTHYRIDLIFYHRIFKM